MNKKLLTLVLAMVMFFTSACSGNSSGQFKEVVKPAATAGAAEITIIMSAFEYDSFKSDVVINSYINKFERDMGVKVNIEKKGPTSSGRISPEYYKEYVKDASMKLYQKDGPELIFSNVFLIKAAVEQGAVLDLKGKVQNVSKIYAGLVGDKIYYAPIMVNYNGEGIKRQILEDLKQGEPGYEFTRADYNRLLDQWMAKANVYFNEAEYWRLYNIDVGVHISRENNSGKIKINTPEVAEGIKKLRQEMFSGKYKALKDFTYQSYYNAIFEKGSEESQIVQQLREQGNYYSGITVCNILRANQIVEISKRENTVILPNFAKEAPSISTAGFMVNKNGKNLELAYEFINGLLSDEVQMEIYNNPGSSNYPVNKDIEAEILKAEDQDVKDSKAKELKKYALSRLKEGQFTNEQDKDYKMINMGADIFENISKLILTDNPYEGENLRLELQKLEDKYNIWLNE